MKQEQNGISEENNPPNDPLPGKKDTDILSPIDKLMKQALLDKLDAMREEIQPQLFDSVKPARDPFVQRANFLYALMFKIRQEYKNPQNVIEFIKELEDKYPLAKQTIDEVKNMLILQQGNN